MRKASEGLQGPAGKATGTSEEAVTHLEDVKMSPFLVKVTLFSGGGPFLEGYVLSIIGVALTGVTAQLHIDALWSGLIGVGALVGIFVGSFIGGWLTDLLGRRAMFLVDVGAIVVLSLLSALIGSAWQLVALRFLIGVAVGADYPIATSMIGEFTPYRCRALALGFLAAVWYLGANVAYVVGYLTVGLPNGWRWMLASTIVPCLVIILGRVSIPESPRWLMSKGRQAEADQVIRQLFGRDVVLDDQPVARTDFRQLFHGTYLRRILFIGVIWLCQAIPMFAIYTYGPVIMQGMGVADGRSQLLGEIIIGSFFLVGTIPAMWLAEKWGRRPLVIWSFLVMSLSLVVLGLVPALGLTGVIVCFGIYALAAGGPGNLEWLYPTELFPTEIRASAMGVATAISRIGTVFSTYVLPSFLARHGSTTTMLAGALISAVGLAVCLAWAPETKGKRLGETSARDFVGR